MSFPSLREAFVTEATIRESERPFWGNTLWRLGKPTCPMRSSFQWHRRCYGWRVKFKSALLLAEKFPPANLEIDIAEAVACLTRLAGPTAVTAAVSLEVHEDSTGCGWPVC